jgi:hypothetical protein
MRDAFPGWYSKSPGELQELWDRAFFVPDANILLHLVRHSSVVRAQLLSVFEHIKDALWIPYQIGLEFHRHRLEVEFAAAEAYDRMMREFQAVFVQAKEKLRQLKTHPVIPVESEIQLLDDVFCEFAARMGQYKANHPTEELLASAERVSQLAAGRVGIRFSANELAAIRREGEERYRNNIPPGFKDQQKTGDMDKYGDLIVWKEMLAKAKSDARPMIFITDDLKEDWWHIHRGRKRGPRPELVEEFLSHTGQAFHIYDLPQFLRYASEKYGAIPQDAVDQLQRAVEEERNATTADVADDRDQGMATIRALEAERDKLISQLAGVPMLGVETLTLQSDRQSLRARVVALNKEIADWQAGLRDIT